MMAGGGGSTAPKNSPRVMPSATPMRSIEAIEGDACRSSTWEIKLGEKPDLSASRRTERRCAMRRRRTMSPRWTAGLEEEYLGTLVRSMWTRYSLIGRAGTAPQSRQLAGALDSFLGVRRTYRPLPCITISLSEHCGNWRNPWGSSKPHGGRPRRCRDHARRPSSGDAQKTPMDSDEGSGAAESLCNLLGRKN